MGAEWPAGAALAMESWPARSRGFMSGILQGSWGLGFLLSSAVYGLFYDSLGWRGMLWIGILPALSVIFVRYFVKEPKVWVENRRLQRLHNREVRAPLFSIFKRTMLRNTFTACWVDGERLRGVLLDLCAVCHASTEGSALHPGPGCNADRNRQP